MCTLVQVTCSFINLELKRLKYLFQVFEDLLQRINFGTMIYTCNRELITGNGSIFVGISLNKIEPLEESNQNSENVSLGCKD